MVRLFTKLQILGLLDQLEVSGPKRTVEHRNIWLLKLSATPTMAYLSIFGP